MCLAPERQVNTSKLGKFAALLRIAAAEHVLHRLEQTAAEASYRHRPVVDMLVLLVTLSQSWNQIWDHRWNGMGWKVKSTLRHPGQPTMGGRARQQWSETEYPNAAASTGRTLFPRHQYTASETSQKATKVAVDRRKTSMLAKSSKPVSRAKAELAEQMAEAL